MKNSKNSGVVFFAVGVVFMVLGINQVALIGLGVAFFAIGAGLMARSRECSYKIK